MAFITRTMPIGGLKGLPIWKESVDPSVPWQIINPIIPLDPEKRALHPATVIEETTAIFDGVEDDLPI